MADDQERKNRKRAYRAEYLQANKETISAQKAAYYQANKETISVRQAAYRQANKEAMRAYSAAYHQANKEDIQARQAAYRQATKVPRSPSRYRRDALRRGHRWELTDERVLWLVRQPCVYCASPGPGGIDRVKNEYGYTRLNAVPCCKKCNYMKRSYGIREFFLAVGAIKTLDYAVFKTSWCSLRERGPE